jgi:sulfate adenylyltransferase
VDTTALPFAILHVEEKFPFDRTRFAREVYGTTGPTHPSVADAFAQGSTALPGPMDLLHRLDHPTGALELSPAETRAEFPSGTREGPGRS